MPKMIIWCERSFKSHWLLFQWNSWYHFTCVMISRLVQVLQLDDNTWSC